MFYQKSTIENHFKCQRCDNNLDKPMLLECGKTVCTACIERLPRKATKNEYECLFCFRKHLIPPSGFPQNELISKLMRQTPSEVYRNEQVESLKTTMASLENELNKLKRKTNDTLDIVKNHCSLLRSKTTLQTANKKTESLLESVNYKISVYEKESLEQLNNTTSEYNQNLNQICAQINEFLVENKNYLERFRIDSGEIADAINKAEELKEKLRVKLTGREEYAFVTNKNSVELDIMLALVNRLKYFC